MTDLPEPLGTGRFPAVGLVAFGQRMHLRQSGLPVAMTGRKNEGTLLTGPEENTPRQTGEPHHVITVSGLLDVPGTLHQTMWTLLMNRASGGPVRDGHGLNVALFVVLVLSAAARVASASCLARAASRAGASRASMVTAVACAFLASTSRGLDVMIKPKAPL